MSLEFYVKIVNWIFDLIHKDNCEANNKIKILEKHLIKQIK